MRTALGVGCGALVCAALAEFSILYDLRGAQRVVAVATLMTLLFLALSRFVARRDPSGSGSSAPTTAARPSHGKLHQQQQSVVIGIRAP